MNPQTIITCCAGILIALGLPATILVFVSVRSAQFTRELKAKKGGPT